MEASKKLSPLAITLIFFAALALMSFVGALHYASDLTDEAVEKVARPARAIEAYKQGYRPDVSQRIVLTSPLQPCSKQWIAKQQPDGRWRFWCVEAQKGAL